MDYYLKLISLKADKAGADPLPFDSDDTYMKLNGKQIWSGDMDTGKLVQNLGTHKFTDVATISL